MHQFTVTCSTFQDGEKLPSQHCGKKGISPAFQFEHLHPDCRSIAVMMEDLDCLPVRDPVHWIMWNIPPVQKLSEAIPHGPIVESLNGAFQGVSRGINCYMGPNTLGFTFKPHRCVFRFYVLDTRLDLIFSAEKRHLLKAMKGHILQTASITALYQK